jgi:hypothetical protein
MLSLLSEPVAANPRTAFGKGSIRPASSFFALLMVNESN